MTIQDLAWHDVPARQIPAICRALVGALPTSLHLLGILMSPTLSAGHSTEADVVRQLDQSISAGHLRLRMYGGLPSPNQIGAVWGLAAVTIGGGLGSAMARCHFWLSSEGQLNQPLTAGFLPSDSDLRAFASAIKQFFLPNIRTAATGGMGMFHSLNDAWRDPLKQLTGFTVLRDNPCVKAAKVLHPDERSDIVAPVGYAIRRAAQNDIPTILGANKIVFTAEYLDSRLPISAVVTSADGELASWALTHEDFSVAALHTAAGHRRRGLAPLTLRQVNAETVRAIAQSPMNPYTPDAPVWVHGDCEIGNKDAQRWFASQGFEPVVRNTWMLLKLDE